MTTRQQKSAASMPRRRLGEGGRALPRGTILNRHGQPVKALTAPAGAHTLESRLERLNAWLEGYNPLRGLTISRVAALLEDYELGRMALVQYAFHFAEKTDPDAIALLDLRLSRLLEMDYNVLIEQDAEEKLAEEQQQFIAERLAYIDNLYDAFEHLAMAPFRGFSHAEKWYDRTGEIYHLETVDQWNVVRDGLRGVWRYNPKAASVDYQFLGAEMDMPPDRFLFREVRRPINRFALGKFVRQNLSDKDWDAFNEIYNVPGGVVIGPPEVPEGEESAYETAAQRIATGGSGYLPHGSEYRPNELPHDSATFENRLKYLSEKHVLAGTGGKLTMLTDATGLGSGASAAHDKVFQSIAKGEARRISEIINRQLVQPWLEKQFPGKPMLAYFQLAANEETDTGDAVDQVSKLSVAGYQVDPEQVTEKTGWKVTLIPQTGSAGGPPAEQTHGNPVTNRASATDAGLPPAALAQEGLPSVVLAKEGNELRFQAASEAALAEADRRTLQPILARIEPIRREAARLADLADEAAFTAGLERLRADLDALTADLPALEDAVLAARPDLEAVMTDIIGTAMLSGMVSSAEAKAAAQSAPTIENRRAPNPARKPAQTRFGVSGPGRGHIRPA